MPEKRLKNKADLKKRKPEVLQTEEDLNSINKSVRLVAPLHVWSQWPEEWKTYRIRKQKRP